MTDVEHMTSLDVCDFFNSTYTQKVMYSGQMEFSGLSDPDES